MSCSRPPLARSQPARSRDDSTLCKAAARAEGGLAVADRGGGVCKTRIARKGGGRSRGHRTIVPYRRGEPALLVQGRANRSKADLRPNAVKAHRLMARDYLPLDSSGLAAPLPIARRTEVQPDD